MRIVFILSLLVFSASIHSCEVSPTFSLDTPPLDKRISKADVVMISKAKIIKTSKQPEGILLLVPIKTIKGKAKTLKVIGISKSEVKKVLKSTISKAKLMNLPRNQPWNIGTYKSQLVYVGPAPCQWHKIIHVEGNMYLVSINKSKVWTNLIEDKSNKIYFDLVNYITTKK